MRKTNREKGILFPNTRSTWRNGKESIRGTRLVNGMLNLSFCQSRYFHLSPIRPYTSLLRSRYFGRHATLLSPLSPGWEALRDDPNNGCGGDYVPLYCYRVNLLKQIKHNSFRIIFGFVIWLGPSEFWYHCFLFYITFFYEHLYRRPVSSVGRH